MRTTCEAPCLITTVRFLQVLKPSHAGHLDAAHGGAGPPEAAFTRLRALNLDSFRRRSHVRNKHPDRVSGQNHRS